MQEITYRIYADESVSNGKYYSNFYGGALVKTTDIPEIEKALNDKKEELNLNGERQAASDAWSPWWRRSL